MVFFIQSVMHWNQLHLFAKYLRDNDNSFIMESKKLMTDEPNDALGFIFDLLFLWNLSIFLSVVAWH